MDCNLYSIDEDIDNCQDGELAMKVSGISAEKIVAETPRREGRDQRL